MARALGSDLPISIKHAIEIANYIRGDSVLLAKKKLEDAIQMKKAIPFKRFTNGLGHKKGELSAGRYVVKACTNMLMLLKSVEANALYKGLNSRGLVISHISAKSSSDSWHYGRQFRRKMKRCNVEIVLEEIKQKKDAKAEKATDKDTEQKVSKEASVKKSEGTAERPKEKADKKPESKIESKSQTKTDLKSDDITKKTTNPTKTDAK